jgi:hypothetical protein
VVLLWSIWFFNRKVISNSMFTSCALLSILRRLLFTPRRKMFGCRDLEPKGKRNGLRNPNHAP